MKKLNQPIDTEDDPLKLVLAESGFSEDQADDKVSVHESLADLGSSSAYGTGGLPVLGTDSKAADSSHQQQNPGPATLRTVRLSSSDPPFSVILDLSGPVTFDQHLDNGDNSASLTLYLHQVTPDPSVSPHMVFDKSIFRDCDIASDANGTKFTVNTDAVSRYAVVPLDQPPRLLVTFTPSTAAANPGQTASFGNAPSPN